MKVGVFGGTFDPIHNGHLRIAEECREHFCLDKVLFTPCASPPHKSEGPFAGPEHRLEMVRRAVESNTGFQADDREIKKGGVSYTIDSLCDIARPGLEIYFIMGLDAFLEIHTWKRFIDLFDAANFIVVDRPWKGVFNGRKEVNAYVKDHLQEVLTPAEKEGCFISGNRINKIWHLQASALDISATRIRSLIQDGSSIRYLTPESVGNYIYETELYT